MMMTEEEFRVKVVELMTEVRDIVKGVHDMQKKAMKVFDECRINSLTDGEG
jgi:hypothetical protein